MTAPDLAAIQRAARCGQLREAERLAEIAVGSTPPGSLDAVRLANLRGGIAFEGGRLDEAESRFEEAIRLATDREDLELAARATNNLGSVVHLRGKAVLAASLYHGALRSYRLRENAVGQAQTEHNLGIVRRDLGQLDQAALHAERAVRLARLSGDGGLLSTALMGAAETAIVRGAHRPARRLLVEARALAREAEDRIGLVEVLRLRGLLAFHVRGFDVALRRGMKGYLTAQRLGSVQLAGECAALAARAACRLARPDLARGLRLRAESCFRTLGARTALRRLAEEFAA